MASPTAANPGSGGRALSAQAAAGGSPAARVATRRQLDALAPRLIPVAEGIAQPLHLTHAGDGSGRIFIVEKAGRIRVLENGRLLPDPFLDIASIVGSRGSEQGLLSVAFHPAFAQNGRLFVHYTDLGGDTVVAEYQAGADLRRADPGSARVILTQDQPFPNHNGGLNLFGPDGYLYIGLGDGGSAGDPQGHGQRLDSWLGKILRIDVDQGDPYGVPPNNPFIGQSQAAPEVWAFGLRNPWRFSFDRATGDLFIADVGQSAYEEIHLQPAGSPGGENYGWNRMEGTQCFPAGRPCDPTGLILPVAEYGRDGGCSITGGFVYRGADEPGLAGIYFYGDYCSGKIWGLVPDESGGWQSRQLLESSARISSFGEDEAGELYVVDFTGRIYRLTGGGR